VTSCSACGFAPGIEVLVCPRCGARLGKAAWSPGDGTVLQESPTVTPQAEGACFVVVEGPDTGAKFALVAGLAIGRDRGCGVVLTDPRVSQKHAHIARPAGRWTLTDLETTNGSFLVLKGEKRRLRAPHALRDGDEVAMGNTVLRFVQLGLGETRW